MVLKEKLSQFESELLEESNIDAEVEMLDSHEQVNITEDRKAVRVKTSIDGDRHGFEIVIPDEESEIQIINLTLEKAKNRLVDMFQRKKD